MFVLTLLWFPSAGLAAIPWDGEGNDGLWFNPANWNRNDNDNITLPPGSPTVTDTEISLGTASLNGGLGVIYNPTPGPGTFFPPADAVNDPPPDYSYQKIAQLYISRSANPPAPPSCRTILLTLRGDLESTGPVIVGRSSGVVGHDDQRQNHPGERHVSSCSIATLILEMRRDRLAPATATARTITAAASWKFRRSGGSGLRLAAGGAGGVAGIGRFIMRNPGPATPGYVRAFDVNVAANEGNATILANGTTTGVGIFEFHSAGTNGTRPIQVNRNLIINNGESGTEGAVRSSRLELMLDAAPDGRCRWRAAKPRPVRCRLRRRWNGQQYDRRRQPGRLLFQRRRQHALQPGCNGLRHLRRHTVQLDDQLHRQHHLDQSERQHGRHRSTAPAESMSFWSD